MTNNTARDVPEVDPQVIIEVLLEENRNMNENRLYLLALLKQREREHAQEKELWDIEKKSLKKGA